MDMQNLVRHYFFDSAPDCRRRLLDAFRDETEEFATLIEALITLLNRFSSANPVYDKTNPKHVAYGLMTKSANTLGAAFELALSGYMWEPPTLLRAALETHAVAWDVAHNPQRFKAWLSDKKFQSTDSISNVKEVANEIGKLYGLLSSMNVHISPLNSSPAMFKTDDSPKFQLFGLVLPGKELARRSEIYFSLFVAYICLQLTELTFYHYAENLETIEILQGADLARTKVSTRHKKFVDTATEVFRRQAEDPSVCF